MPLSGSILKSSRGCCTAGRCIVKTVACSCEPFRRTRARSGAKEAHTHIAQGMVVIDSFSFLVDVMIGSSRGLSIILRGLP